MTIREKIQKSGQPLCEVKAGQPGMGLLVERDFHIIGNDDMVNQIKEDIQNDKKFVIPDRFIVNAIFQKYGVKNANGRIYPENVLKPEVERYIREKINGFGNCAIGSGDHPQNSSLSIHDVSHKILNLSWKGCTLVGEMELHLSPGYRRYGVCSTSGDLVANLILDGILVGVSSRALGNVIDKYGTLIVDDDLELIGWDTVIENSTPGAHIFTNPKDMEQFIESKVQDDSKLQIQESKLDRLNKILLF
jgi:hypothetical protein